MTSPFPRVRRPGRIRALVVTSLVGVVLAAMVVAGVVMFASRRPDEVNLGDKTFVVGSAERFADRISEQRTPILFKDPLTSRPGREVYVQHLGPGHKEGWLAIEAYAPGRRRLECILRWERGAQRFRDPCSQRTYPSDGGGLRTYAGKVDESGKVVIDLRTDRGGRSS